MMGPASYNQNRTDVSLKPSQCADVLYPSGLTEWAGQGEETGRGWMCCGAEEATPLDK